MNKLIHKMRNRKEGFTLIELIVVIAILGILAAILVPSMMGILADSQKKVNDANARTVFTSAQIYVSMQASKGAPIADATYDSTVTADATVIDGVKGYLGAGFSGTFKFTVASGAVTTASFSKDTDYTDAEDGVYTP